MKLPTSTLESVRPVASPSSIAGPLTRGVPQPKAELSGRVPEPPPAEELRAQVRESNAALSGTEHRVSIELHEESGRFVVRVHGAGDELLRQFPSEELLSASERLRDLRGLLFEGQG